LQPFYQNQRSLQLNRSIEGLKGKLKIRVMADKSDTTLAALLEATFLPKSAPGLHPFIATVSMLDWVGKTPLNVTTYGELTQLDPYTDDNYHLVVSVGEDGSLQLNRSNIPFFQSNCNLSTKISAWITSFHSDCVNA
jgi:hypothetical protein